ncbi:MAG: glycosyltransferase family 9 protein, partial [bacterium]
ELIVYNKKSSHKGVIAHIKFILKLRKNRFTHSFHLKRFFRNGFISFLSGIPNRLGFETEGKAPFLTKTIGYRNDQNIVLTNMSLLSLLGTDVPVNIKYIFYSSEKNASDAMKFVSDNGLRQRRFVIIHCGGESFGNTDLSVKIYSGLVSHLWNTMGIETVLICGPGDEHAVKGVRNKIGESNHCYVHNSDCILVTAELMKLAGYFTGNNSGHSHLAALVGLPETVIYFKEDDQELLIEKWLPWQKNCGYVIIDTDVDIDKTVKNIGKNITL